MLACSDNFFPFFNFPVNQPFTITAEPGVFVLTSKDYPNNKLQIPNHLLPQQYSPGGLGYWNGKTVNFNLCDWIALGRPTNDIPPASEINSILRGLYASYPPSGGGGGGMVETVVDSDFISGQGIKDTLNSTPENIILKKINAGANITLTPAEDHVTISSEKGGEVNTVTASNIIDGHTLINPDSTSTAIKLKDLLEGPGIILNPTGDSIEITLDGTVVKKVENTAASGESLISSASTDEQILVKRLKAGTNISLTDDGDSISISSTGSSASLTRFADTATGGTTTVNGQKIRTITIPANTLSQTKEGLLNMASFQFSNITTEGNYLIGINTAINEEVYCSYQFNIEGGLTDAVLNETLICASGENTSMEIKTFGTLTGTTYFNLSFKAQTSSGCSTAYNIDLTQPITIDYYFYKSEFPAPSGVTFLSGKVVPI